ncbi:hybrid sensor histidine kinase/response regulator transcription factor [Lewinella cohaerens]|uniref:hybrid sensor histidine kinase/response regulator transcription factor n=1 Tax=Lewinella cohaerens TaxID=70995 RepID=UPI00037FEFD5|nr:response regulator [Lewinella cohaerens]
MSYLPRIKPVVMACLLVFFCCLSMDGQSVERRYVDGDYILEISLWTKEDGLPSWHIFDIIEDKKGVLWLATNVGLVRFDGNSFTTYNGEEHGLSSNRIGRIAEDVNGNIWLFCSQGDDRVFDVFDPIEESAIPLQSYINEELPLSSYSHYGFFRQQDTIWLLDPVSGKGGRYQGEWEWLLNDTSTSRVLGIMGKTEDFPYYYPRKDGLFWVWKTKEGKLGLYVIDRNGKELSNLNFGHNISRFSTVDEDLNLYYWSQPQYLGDLDTLFSFGDNSIRTYPYGSYPSISWGNSAYHNHSRFLKINKDGFGFAANNATSFFFKEDEILFENLGSLLAKDFQARINEIIVLIDNESFWFNSPEGLFRMRVKKSLFTTYTHQDDIITSVRGMVGIGDSLLMVNTYAGMFQVDLHEKYFSSLPIANGYNNMGLLKEENQVWVSKSSDDLMLYNLIDRNYKTYPFRFYNGEYNGYSLHRLNDTALWIASHLGVLAFNEKSGSIQPQLMQDTSAYFWHTNNQGLWLGCQYGLFLFNEEGQRKKHFPVLEDDKTELRVYFIHEDEDGVFWLGTNQGLVCWNQEDETYRKYTVEDGLSDNKIHAIYEDSYGHLWLPSNYGLMRFRKSDGYVTTYLEKDGLPSNEFNFLAYFQREDGLLFLGGVNGIVSFYPDSIGAQAQAKLHLQMAKVVVYDRKTEAVINKTRQGIERGLVEIRPSQNRLEISLVPHYFIDSEVVYEWRFPWESEQWKVFSGAILSLINPNYGTYPVEFRAYPVGNKKLQSKILSLQLKVLKPIYLRWWFFALLALTVGGGFYGYFRLRQLQLKLHNEELEQEVNDRTLELQEKLETIDLQAKELRQLDEMKSRFFINISHELRTPLSMILGPVIALSKEQFSTEHMSQLQRIKRSTKQLRQMIEEILDLARLEAGKLELREEVVVFSPFIKRVFNAFHSLAVSRNINYKLVLDAPVDLRLMLDTQKVERILNNLISNALKFTGRGGQVMVKVVVDSTAIMMAVEDTGVGINETDLARIFDRYYQARHQGILENGGLGIGLAMSKELAVFLGGDLEVESELGKGSVFSIKLPVLVADEALPELKTTSEQDILTKTRLLTLPPPANAAEQPMVLIAEDNDDFRAYLLEILRPYYRLVQASDGLEALDVLNQQEVDLVVSDVMMPRMDGFELLKAVRSQPQQWGLPFILLTARSEQADQLYGLRLGVDTYLSKPFEENELIARIHNLLSNQQKRKAAFEAAVIPEKEEVGASSEKAPPLPGLSFDELWLIDLEALLAQKIRNPQLKVGDLAREMAMSERSFRDKLKDCTGLKPSQYILQARLQLAYRLLEEKRYSTIAELVYAIGFQSKAYFSKSFKLIYGKSPSEMLK